ncbi:glutathione S-transferase [Novosphingobium endophyticum]|uniref:Glutathione S-transferase n=1 Tax=Novosphingobium endophyticum TaxID=1955250 RepID=A0A916TVI6_9SPHN|nr:glutathione S-transferase family protein [Novosphingobium endophyticum]GGC09663.1 glutathione S-transferase [Novosphingobium endophyticum]
MKIYTSPNSPFGARIRIAAKAKGMDLESLPLPEGGLHSATFLKINPIARIPVLVTEDGTTIPESSVILDYLEDRFPAPSLLPESPENRARLRLAGCIMDRYVMDPVIRLFPQLSPGERDDGVVSAEIARWRAGLDHLACFMVPSLPVAPAPASLADCILAPSLHLGTRIAAMLGLERDPMLAHPVLVEYYDRARQNPVIAPVLSELTAAQARKDAQAGLPSLAHLH